MRGKGLVAATAFNSRGVEGLLEGRSSASRQSNAITRSLSPITSWHAAHDRIYLWEAILMPSSFALFGDRCENDAQITP